MDKQTNNKRGKPVKPSRESYVIYNSLNIFHLWILGLIKYKM